MFLQFFGNVPRAATERRENLKVLQAQRLIGDPNLVRPVINHAGVIEIGTIVTSVFGWSTAHRKSASLMSKLMKDLVFSSTNVHGIKGPGMIIGCERRLVMAPPADLNAGMEMELAGLAAATTAEG